MSHFNKKSIASMLATSQAEESTGLARTITPLTLILFGIGGTIGSGIFVLTGQAAANYAGPAIVISFIISGIACAFAALCYSELASMIPISGSAYTYAFATMGKFIAWIIGWDLILEYLFGVSTIAVGWSGYFISFLKDFGIHIPEYITKPPFIYTDEHGWAASGSLINLPAVFVIAFLTFVSYLGIKESAKLNNIIVFVKIAVLFIFIGIGLQYINWDNLTPFIPENTGPGKYGWSGILRASGVIFFAYIGFDSLSTLSQESKNPQRDMPIGIIGALIAVTILYITVCFVMTGMVHYSKLGVAEPIAVALDATGGSYKWFIPIIKFCIVFGLLSPMLMLIIGQTRILYCMSKDGFLPNIFSEIHQKFRTPHKSTLITGVIAAFFGGIFPINILGELVSIGTLLAFIIVCLGVLVLRYTDPDAHRPFKTPAVWPVSILGAASAFLQMYYLPGDTWIRLIVWMVIGLIVYFAYSNKNCKV